MATLRIHGSKPHTYKKFPLQKKIPRPSGRGFFILVGCVTDYHVHSFSQDIVTLPRRTRETTLSTGEVKTITSYDGMFTASTFEDALVMANDAGYSKLLSIEYGRNMYLGLISTKWVTIRCSKTTIPPA